jgi:hypothetical protein
MPDFAAHSKQLGNLVSQHRINWLQAVIRLAISIFCLGLFVLIVTGRIGYKNMPTLATLAIFVPLLIWAIQLLITVSLMILQNPIVLVYEKGLQIHKENKEQTWTWEQLSCKPTLVFYTSAFVGAYNLFATNKLIMQITGLYSSHGRLVRQIMERVKRYPQPGTKEFSAAQSAKFTRSLFTRIGVGYLIFAGLFIILLVSNRQ